MQIKHNKHIMHNKATLITVVCFTIPFKKPNTVTYFHTFEPKITKTNCTHFTLTKICSILSFESLIAKKIKTMQNRNCTKKLKSFF